MKKAVKILIIAFLLCVFTYVCKIENIPNSVILYNGENLEIGDFLGVSLKIDDEDCNTVLTASNIGEDDEKINYSTVDVKLFDTFTVKEISINVVEETTVIPVGQITGLELYTDGVLVVGMSEIKGEDNQKYKPYENSGIEEGDRIIKIDSEVVTDTNSLINIVNDSKGKELELEYIKDEELQTTYITPVKYTDGTYKLGLWVRDSAAGIRNINIL